MEFSAKNPRLRKAAKRYMTKASIYWTVALIALLLFIYFMPGPILYSFRWTAFCIIFFLLPPIVFKTFQTYNINRNWPIILACSSVLIVGPTFALFHQYTELQELKNNGVWTKAIVIDEKRSYSKGYKGWLIKLSFKAKDKDYETAYENDEKNLYSVGDTIDIIYLGNFPEVHELDYQWKKE